MTKSASTQALNATPNNEYGPYRARGRGHHARTMLAVALGVYLVLQVILSRAVEQSSSAIGDPIFAEKFELLDKHAEFFSTHHSSPRLLTIGSSRTLLAFDAKSFGEHTNISAFNFGCHGCGPITGTLYLRRLIEKGLRAEIVLLEIHPAMLANHNPPFESRWLHTYRLKRDEIAILRSYGWDIPYPDQHGFFGWISNVHTYRFSALDQYAPKLSTCPFGMSLRGRVDEFGHVKGTENSICNREAALLRECSVYLPAMTSYRPGGPAVESIHSAIIQCKLHRVTPILMVSAESSEYRSWYGNGGECNIRDWINQFAENHNVRVIDSRKWIPDHEFTDGHHVTVAGAETFTNRLAEEFRQ